MAVCNGVCSKRPTSPLLFFLSRFIVRIWLLVELRVTRADAGELLRVLEHPLSQKFSSFLGDLPSRYTPNFFRPGILKFHLFVYYGSHSKNKNMVLLEKV